MTYFTHLTEEIFATVILLIIIISLRIISAKLIRRYATLSSIMEHRTNLVIKYIHILINILALIGVIVIWGVQKKGIFLTLT